MPPLRLSPDVAPWMAAPETRAVIDALRSGGRQARFVGGCVRDAIAKRAVTDIDLATPETPDRVVELLQRAGLKAVPTGIEHGTITAISGGRPFEITTLRRDVVTDGRRAVVEFTDDWVADAARRDFTINALSADITGEIHDPFGGVDDLAAGCVRFVGDPATRIQEDVLRILRFFRFHAHYGHDAPDGDGLIACQRHADRLPDLSGERVAAELLKLLAAPDPAATIERMRAAGILAPILPELVDVPRLRRLQIARAAGARDPVLRLAALISGDAAAPVAQRLHLAIRDRDRLAAALNPVRDLWPARDVRARRRALYRKGAVMVADWALLAWADGDEELGRAGWEAAQAWAAPILPVRGQDAIDLGVPPGKAIGRLIEAVESWWEDGDYGADRVACLAKLKTLVEGG